MSVEIDQPEIEALIEQRIASGHFQDAEEVLLFALRSAPFPNAASAVSAGRTGAEIVAAMQAMPYKDVDLEPLRPQLPVRDAAF
jgi:hypothetical protein